MFNCTPVPRNGYRLGVPGRQLLEVILNSDAEMFGGSNVGNPPLLQPEAKPWMGQAHSVELTLPPLGALYLKSTSAPAAAVEPI